jgi:ABC-type Fe3+ transport system permease subunit
MIFRRAAVLVTAALLALCVLLPGVSAAASLEGGQALNELSQGAQEEETTSTEATTSTSKESGNSSKTVFIGAGAAGVLLLVIAFVIVRDARRVAPAGAEDFIDGRPGTSPIARQRKRRAKARAARKQRKRNR